VSARGFTAIPNAIVRDKTLPAGTRMLYGVILSYAFGSGRCTRNSRDLAEEAGVGRTAFFEGVALLQERGLLTIEKVKYRGGWANAYIPTLSGVTVPDHEERSPESERPVVRVADGGSSARRTQKKTTAEEDSETDVSEIVREDAPASMTYRGKKVPKAIVGTAARSVRYFASKTGQTLRVVDDAGKPTTSMTRVVGAMLAHRELADPEFAKRTIDFALAAPWWRDEGPPGVGVVFGPGVVERMVEQARRDEPPAPRPPGGSGRPSASDLLRKLRA
jgi:hypothetical protein